MSGDSSPEQVSEKPISILGVDIEPDYLAKWNHVMDEVKKTGGDITITLLNILDDEGYENPEARALASIALTSPKDHKLSFAPERVGIESLVAKLGGSDKVKNMRAAFKKHPKLSQDIASGVSHWMDTILFEGSFFSYTSMNRALLPVVDKAMADRLAARYPLSCNYGNLCSHKAIVDARGDLLHDPEIPVRFRRVALQNWLTETSKQIEHPGESKNIGDVITQSALPKFLQMDVVVNPGHGNDSTLTTIVGYLEDNAVQGETYVNGPNCIKIAEHIKSEQTKFDFMYRHFFSSQSNLPIQYRRIDTESELEQIKWAMNNVSRFVKPREDWLTDENVQGNVMWIGEGLIRDYQEETVGRAMAEQAKRAMLFDSLR